MVSSEEVNGGKIRIALMEILRVPIHHLNQNLQC